MMDGKKVLIICNTYYQMIFAIHLKETLFKKTQVSLIVTDQTNGIEQIIPKLEKKEIFFEVFFEKTKKLYRKKRRLFAKVSDIRRMVKGNPKYNYIYKNRYDKLLYFNPDIFTHMIFAGIYEINRKVNCSRYEEGVLSYDNRFDFAFIKIVAIIRKLFRKYSLADRTKKFFCCYPEIYDGPLLPIKVPPIKKESSIGSVLADLFDVKFTSSDYKEKYIFFTSLYDIEGEHPIGEFEIIEKTAELMGKENLLLKVHPRDTRDIYNYQGYHIDKNSTIPWEAIQLSLDFSDKVFLTVSSGSVLSSNLMVENGTKTYFLYKMSDFKKNKIAQRTIAQLESLLKNSKMQEELHRVIIADSVEEVMDEL